MTESHSDALTDLTTALMTESHSDSLTDPMTALTMESRSDALTESHSDALTDLTTALMTDFHLVLKTASRKDCSLDGSLDTVWVRLKVIRLDIETAPQRVTLMARSKDQTLVAETVFVSAADEEHESVS
jgi:hypothetical protein